MQAAKILPFISCPGTVVVSQRKQKALLDPAQQKSHCQDLKAIWPLQEKKIKATKRIKATKMGFIGWFESYFVGIFFFFFLQWSGTSLYFLAAILPFSV